MSAFVGTWELASSENLEAYMNLIGVPDKARQVMKDNKIALTIAIDGDTWTITTRTAGKEHNIILRVGETLPYKTFMGSDMTGIIKSVGDKVEEEHFGGDLKIETTREVINGQLCITTSAKGVTAKLFYDKK